MPQRSILLVDDVDFFLELEKDFLSQTPAAIVTAKNGREALEAVARERPNLIFLDVNMPVMDGLTCCRRLKADPRLAEIPVVMVFAPSKDVTVATCRDAGCDGTLTKPLDRNAFLEMGHTFLFQIDRRESRVPCEFPVTVRRAAGEVSASCVDLSPGGMYIACREEVQPNEMMRVAIRFTGAPGPVEVRARVAWVNRGFPRSKMHLPQGFGVQFLHPDAEARTSIRETLAKARG
jgi:uncharacterized protein (TIGR02266 family)